MKDKEIYYSILPFYKNTFLNVLIKIYLINNNTIHKNPFFKELNHMYPYLVI